MSPAGCRIGVAAYAGKSLVNGSATQYSALMSIGSVRDRESVMPVSVSGGKMISFRQITAVAGKLRSL